MHKVRLALGQLVFTREVETGSGADAGHRLIRTSAVDQSAPRHLHHTRLRTLGSGRGTWHPLRSLPQTARPRRRGRASNYGGNERAHGTPPIISASPWHTEP